MIKLCGMIILFLSSNWTVYVLKLIKLKDTYLLI